MARRCQFVMSTLLCEQRPRMPIALALIWATIFPLLVDVTVVRIDRAERIFDGRITLIADALFLIVC